MEKNQAIALSNLLEDWSVESISPAFEINKLEVMDERLAGFHQWTNGKPVIAGYNILKIGEKNLYFLFIDWHRNDNYYLVIYSGNKATTHAEIQHIVEYEGKAHLLWKYNPLKRDGRNLQRKAYFKQIFGSLSIHIPLPTSSIEVESFLQNVFKLCANRVKADQIVNVFPINE